MNIRQLSLVAAIASTFLSHQVAAVRADAPATTTAPKPPAVSSTVPSNPSGQATQQDRNKVRTDQQEAHSDRVNIRNDRQAISQDRTDMQNARKDMQINPQNKAADQAKITADQQHIKTERQDINKNRQDLNHVQNNARNDVSKHRSDRPSMPPPGGTNKPSGGKATGTQPSDNPGRPASAGSGFMVPSHQGPGAHSSGARPTRGGGTGGGHAGRR